MMKLKNYLGKPLPRSGLVLLLAGLLLTLAATGLALAQAPEPAGAAPVAERGPRPVWLVLDSAEAVDTLLPPLLARLADLKAGGQIIAYDSQPRQSAPQAVWALPVTPHPARYSLLAALPGVLAVVDQLPPAPPQADLNLQAATTITGRVTEALSPTTAISAALIRVYDIFFIHRNAPGATTDASGFYSTTVDSTFSPVKIRFNKSGYGEKWYDNKLTFGTANTVAISGSPVPSISAQLERANAALTGTVTVTPGGALLTGGSVILYRVSDGQPISNTLTSNGLFTFANLVAGGYKVEFSSGTGLPIVPEFYQDKTSLATATPILLTANTTTTITALVERTAVITGQVTDAATLLPIISPGYNVGVTVYDQNNKFVTNAQVDGPTGIYTATGFGSGSYKLQFSAAGTPPYQTEFYSNALTISAATLVTASAGLTRTINEDLILATAAITGQVTSFTGTRLANIQVDLYRFNPAIPNYQFETNTNTDANGLYTFSNRLNGQYKVLVGFFDDDIIPHAFAWYLNSGTITGATTITISNNLTRTGINVQLQVGGCIAGKIIDSAGVAKNNAPFTVSIPGADPVPVFSAGGGANPTFTLTPSSDNVGQGEFLVCGLPTGVYDLNCGFAKANGINVIAGQVTSGVICGGGIKYYLPRIVKKQPG